MEIPPTNDINMYGVPLSIYLPLRPPPGGPHPLNIQIMLISIRSFVYLFRQIIIIVYFEYHFPYLT